MADNDKIDNMDQLRNAVKKMHGCKAAFINSVSVVEMFEGKTVWEGIVNIFKLENHPKATKCYAWSSQINGSKKRKYYAVLHIPPIDSPEKAVRASIIADYRSQSREA